MRNNLNVGRNAFRKFRSALRDYPNSIFLFTYLSSLFAQRLKCVSNFVVPYNVFLVTLLLNILTRYIYKT